MILGTSTRASLGFWNVTLTSGSPAPRVIRVVDGIGTGRAHHFGDDWPGSIHFSRLILLEHSAIKSSPKGREMLGRVIIHFRGIHLLSVASECSGVSHRRNRSQADSTSHWKELEASGLIRVFPGNPTQLNRLEGVLFLDMILELLQPVNTH